MLQFTNESPLLDPRSLARQPVAALKVWASQPPFRRKKKRKGKKRGGRSGVTQALQARKFTSSHQPAVAGLGAVVVGGQAAWLRRSSWPRAARGDRETPDYLESQGAGYLPSPSPVWVFFLPERLKLRATFCFFRFPASQRTTQGCDLFKSHIKMLTVIVGCWLLRLQCISCAKFML